MFLARLRVEKPETRRLLAVYPTVDHFVLAADFAEDPMFDSVGYMYRQMGDVWGRSGRAVLIAPDWLPTAGHCLTPDPTYGDVTALEFFTGD